MKQMKNIMYLSQTPSSVSLAVTHILIPAIFSVSAVVCPPYSFSSTNTFLSLSKKPSCCHFYSFPLFSFPITVQRTTSSTFELSLHPLSLSACLSILITDSTFPLSHNSQSLRVNIITFIYWASTARIISNIAMLTKFILRPLS